MVINLIEDGLLIIPETEFEKHYISQFQIDKLEAFVKTGASLSDIVGLKIKIIRKEKKCTNHSKES